MLKIRRYQPEDNAVVKALHFAGIEQMHEISGAVRQVPSNFDCDLDDIEKTYLNNHGDFLVGMEGKEIVAIGGIRKFSETCGEIKRIRVRRDRQRRGYAEAIMIKLIELAGGLGYKKLILDTMSNNLAAQRLFEKLGFTKMRRDKKGPYDVIYYGKQLKQGG